MSQVNTSREVQQKEWEDRFEMLTAMVGKNTPKSIQSLRKAAIDAFSDQGFPTTKNEEWKYTSIAPLLKEGFSPSLIKKPHSITPEIVDKYSFRDTQCHLIVCVNGFFEAELSRIISGDLLEIKGLGEELEKSDPLFIQSFGQIANAGTNAFTALSTAFSTDGVYIHIPKGKTANYPVHILHFSDTKDNPVFAQQRNLIIAEENAELSVYESHYTIGESKSLTNTLTEISAGDDSRVKHFVIQNDTENGNQIRTTQIAQGKNSNVKNVTITLGGTFIRNDLNYLHKGQHCESYLYGLYHLNGNQHVDNHSLVDHAQPNSYSNELYKGILDGQSTGVFNGKVMVRQDAQKTNAFQSNRNLLLADGATINTKPQLEIWADDVKCSHGATTGRLDEAAMFYLRARGVGKDAAKALLTYAFASEVLDEIEVESIRDLLKDQIAQKLNAENLV